MCETEAVPWMTQGTAQQHLEMMVTGNCFPTLPLTSHETREDTLSILSDPILNKKFLAQNLQPYNLLLLGRQAASNSEFNRDSRILTDDGGVRTGNKNPARCLVAHSFNPSTQRQKQVDI